MGCKSAIYTTNSTNQALTVNSLINLGSIIRRFGCNINYDGSGISIKGNGYYSVDADMTITGTDAGTIVVTLLKDGIAVPGAKASVSVAVGDVVTVGLNSLVKECSSCCDNTSVLTFVITGVAATVNNISVVVTKI